MGACGLWVSSSGRATGRPQPVSDPLPAAVAERAEHSSKEMLLRGGPGHSKVVCHPHNFLRIFFFPLSLFNSGYILWRNVRREKAVSVCGDRLGVEAFLMYWRNDLENKRVQFYNPQR